MNASILKFKRPDDELRRRDLDEVFYWRFFRAFLFRRVKMFRTLSTVSIVFENESVAREFMREILQKAARK